jgi:RNA polymerase sigma-70 factor (ECF subfamily)
MLTKEQEQELILKAQTDINAFGPLYDAYFSMVFGFIFKRVRDQDTTGELTSIVFMKAMNALPKYKITGAPFSSWLVQIALNEVRQFQRKNTKRQTVPLSENDLKAVYDEIDQDSTSERDLSNLVKGLNQLDEEAANYIELRFFEGRPFAEMAEILGISADNAKVRTYRVLKQLRTIIANFGPTE